MTQNNNKPVHVLEIVGNAIVGGVEQSVQHIAERLPAQNYRVTCVTPYESPVTARLRALGVPLFVTPMEDNPSWRSIQFLTELVHAESVDLIHAHLPRAQMLGGIAGRLADVPVLMTIHGMDINSWELGILRTTNATMSVVCQTAYYQALALGVPPEKVRLIPNGVDIERFHLGLDGTQFRASLKIPEGAPLVGFVGRLMWEKGPDIFQQLARHVLSHKPDVHFVMVGDGYMQGEIEDLIRRDSLEANIHLAGVRSDMPSVYPALDLLVQTSRVEGMPLTLLEGMACGLPVAAMNVGGVGEIVEVGATGLLAAPGDWAGLGDSIVHLLGNPAQQQRMGRAARERVVEKFDLKDSLARLAQVGRDLVKRRAAVKTVRTGTPARSITKTGVGNGGNSPLPLAPSPKREGGVK